MESYLNHMNSGCDGEMDLLTHNLNSVGQRLAVGDKLMYNWFWARDPNVSMRHYRGFMKCTYARDARRQRRPLRFGEQQRLHQLVPLETHPNWMKQQIALGHVHALFSYLEDYIRNGDLVDDGKFRHVWSTEHPAYDLLPKELDGVVQSKGDHRVLPLGRPVRVLARKHQRKPEWLVEARTADTKSGDDKRYDASLTIPGAGEVKLEGRPCGNTCPITLKKGRPVARLLDPDPDDPSGAFRPENAE